MQHLAVFSKGVIELILADKKTVEARFSKMKFSPYKRVQAGDVVFMKESGGKVKGKFKVKDVVFLENLNPQKMKNLKSRYSRELVMPDSFWESKSKSKYASIVFIENVEALVNPITLDKHDKRSWVVLSQVKGISSRSQMALRFSDKDSISSLAELIKLTKKEKGLKRKESLEELGLDLAAAVGTLCGYLKDHKNSGQNNPELGEVMISLVKLAEAQGVDLFRATKDQIQGQGQKLSLDKLKEIK